MRDCIYLRASLDEMKRRKIPTSSRN
jgi:hypothetical protein